LLSNLTDTHRVHTGLGARLPEDMPELHARALHAVDHSEGRLRVAISNALVSIWKQDYGRGPTAARTIVDQNLVFVVLQDGLTRNEQTLLAAGHEAAVRDFRMCFMETMSEKFIASVEEVTGGHVLTHASQVAFAPAMTIETFVLDGPLPDHPM
jgi:uncharacterized protein YbcI